MPSRTLTCRCGHSWEQPDTAQVPSDIWKICPICAPSGQSTVDNVGSTTDLTSAGEPNSFKPGQVLSGFEVLEEINRGGMGVIYKARQQGLNRLVALKVITPDRLSKAEAKARFQREVQAAALLSHPNIVTVFHTDLDGPRPYLAMEYVAGIDLWKLVKRTGPLSVRDACSFIREAAKGLQHAYEHKLVHRDIKPSNLMITPSPLDLDTGATMSKVRLKILDMGLARVMAGHDDDEEAASLTRAGEFLGTPDYVAPEQAEDPRQADIRSDIYSLGGTFYFLLVGKVPFPGGSLVQKLRRQVTEPTPSVADHRPDVPPVLDALIKKMMARDPLDRYQTPAELLADLTVIVKQGVPSQPASKGPAPGAGIIATPTPSPSPRTPSPGMALKTSPPIQVQPTTSNLLTETVVTSTEAHRGGVRAVCVSTDGKFVLTGGEDETLRLWDVNGLREIRCLAGDVGPVQSAALAPNGKWAVSCALRLFKADMVVQCWDLSSGGERRRLKGLTDAVACVAIAPDGRHVAGGSADQTIRIWAVDQHGSPSIALVGHTGPITSVVFLAGGESLLSGSEDGTVRLWDTKTGVGKGSIIAQVGRVEAVAFSRPGKCMAIAGQKLRVRQSNGSFVELVGHRGPVLSVDFSPNGQLVTSGGRDETVRLWRAQDGRLLKVFERRSGMVQAVTFAADGQTIYAGSADGSLRLWSVPH